MKRFIAAGMLSLLAGCAEIPLDAKWEDYAKANRCEATDHKPIDVWVARAVPPTKERMVPVKCKDQFVWVMIRDTGSPTRGSFVE